MGEYGGEERRADLFDQTRDIQRRLTVIEESIHSLINDQNASTKELLNRVGTLELIIAEARGMKAGVIAAFSLMWAASMAAIAAAWKWLHSLA